MGKLKDKIKNKATRMANTQDLYHNMAKDMATRSSEKIYEKNKLFYTILNYIIFAVITAFAVFLIYGFIRFIWGVFT